MFDKHQHRYNAIAKQWHELRKQKPINTCIVELLPFIKSQGHVLDVGCGTGYPITHYLATLGFTVTGIDVAEAMLAFAQSLKLPRTTLLHADIQMWQSPIHYDAIIAFDSLFHLPMNAQVPVLNKLCQWLHPGGVLLFTHGHQRGEIHGDMFGTRFDYSALDGQTYRDILSAQGMKILRYEAPYEEPTTGKRDLLIVAQKQLIHPIQEK